MTNLDYGVIGNCGTAALISQRGDIEWLCFPDFDRASVFSAILDREKGGLFGFYADGWDTEQRYLEGTNILVTTFSRGPDAFEVQDFMPRYRLQDGDYYLPPEVYRLLRPLRGNPRLRIRYEPVLDYARCPVRHQPEDDCVVSVCATEGREAVYLYSSMDLEAVVGGWEITLQQEEYLLCSYYQKLVPVSLDRVHLEYERTKVYWLNWSSRSARLKRYREPVERSLLVLKLMTFEQTGAILAALTTSIPETVGSERNWDYRYCWIRDASMSVNTLLSMGHRHTARRFLRFIRRIMRSKQEGFQIMYGIRGERRLEEYSLDHLEGFAGSRPVRVGNAAYDQKQNDIFGYLLDVMYRYCRFFGGPQDDIEEMWEIVKKVAVTVMQDWQEPDSGIWELRNRTEHFVFSKVMCWVALDRAAHIAGFLGRKKDETRFRAEADAIRADVLDKGWNADLNSFTQSYGNTDMDASLLLMEQYGFIGGSDPRFKGTVERVKQELLHNGLMFRYRNRDDFGDPESAFTICTFWLVRALFVTGKRDEARELFEEAVATANHVGLLSEDLDFATRGQLGNFPQAYSHLALIDMANLLDESTSWPTFILP